MMIGLHVTEIIPYMHPCHSLPWYYTQYFDLRYTAITYNISVDLFIFILAETRKKELVYKIQFIGPFLSLTCGNLTPTRGINMFPTECIVTFLLDM